MLWADDILNQAKKRYADIIESGRPLIIRDEKTMSGRVHIGSLRGVAIHGLVQELSKEIGLKTKFLFEINDFDPMDGLPVYLDQEVFRPHMGKLLSEVPSPDGKAKNYAEYFADEFIGVIQSIGYQPDFYRSSECYRSGKYNQMIKMALDSADEIREIYKRISGAVKEEGWLPISVRCQNCQKIGTTVASDWDGEEVSYKCGNYVEWAFGCGHNGKVSPLDGKAKLPWKVEWAAKFSVFDVHIEGGGKDHSTKGGAREIADAISREVFKREPPINIPYEFIHADGKKMSSSKGKGVSSKEVADLLPPQMVRTLLLQKDPARVVEFIPDGDTVPILYDSYDRFAKNYWSGNTDDFAQLFPFLHPLKLKETLLKQHLLPRFSNVAYLVQMPHLDLQIEIEKLEAVKLDQAGMAELDSRRECAKRWLSGYAPENFKFDIQKILPAVANNFSSLQKDGLRAILEYLENNKTLDGQILHTELHEIKTRLNIPPKDFFIAIYQSILGKDSGPKAGWFLSVLDKEFLIKRLDEVVKT